MELGLIRELLNYHCWANDRILTAAEAISVEEYRRDMGSSFPSIQATLAHLMSAEAIWLSRWNGETLPIVRPEDVDTPAAARERWRSLEEQLRSFIGGLTQEELGRVHTIRTSAGKEFRHSLGEMLYHLFNHGTYHRGQVVTLLRQMGAEASSTDLILYYRQRSGQI